jgi:hypothetical protein
MLHDASFEVITFLFFFEHLIPCYNEPYALHLSSVRFTGHFYFYFFWKALNLVLHYYPFLKVSFSLKACLYMMNSSKSFRGWFPRKKYYSLDFPFFEFFLDIRDTGCSELILDTS